MDLVDLTKLSLDTPYMGTILGWVRRRDRAQQGQEIGKTVEMYSFEIDYVQYFFYQIPYHFYLRIHPCQNVICLLILFKYNTT